MLNPDFSRDLAIVVRSPYFVGKRDQKNALQAALPKASTLESLPKALQNTIQRAIEALPVAQRNLLRSLPGGH